MDNKKIIRNVFLFTMYKCEKSKIIKEIEEINKKLLFPLYFFVNIY